MVTTPTSSHVEENTNSNLHTISGKMIDGARAGKSVAVERKHEWGVILAGGDGTRLKSLTRRIIDDERPKQFCPVMGDVALHNVLASAMPLFRTDDEPTMMKKLRPPGRDQLFRSSPRAGPGAARGSEGKRHQMERSR